MADEDNDNHVQNIYNQEANKYCPNDNPLIDFAGHKWWINYHWSNKTGTYVWGGDDPKEPLFGTIFDPNIIEHNGGDVKLWIKNQPMVISLGGLRRSF